MLLWPFSIAAVSPVSCPLMQPVKACTLNVLVVLLTCRDGTDRQHATPGLAIVAAVGAAAHRGGAAWDSVKSLLPQVHIGSQVFLIALACRTADRCMCERDFMQGTFKAAQ